MLVSLLRPLPLYSDITSMQSKTLKKSWWGILTCVLYLVMHYGFQSICQFMLFTGCVGRRGLGSIFSISVQTWNMECFPHRRSSKKNKGMWRVERVQCLLKRKCVEHSGGRNYCKSLLKEFQAVLIQPLHCPLWDQSLRAVRDWAAWNPSVWKEGERKLTCSVNLTRS